jgi:hypothetical protein
MVANSAKQLKVRLRNTMRERKISFPKLEKLTGIPKERMYKWYSEDTNPKVGDVEVLEKWISGDLEKVPHNTVSSGNENHQAQSTPAALEQAILNLSESDIIKARALESSARNLEVSARNLERVIHLLEIKMGVTPNVLEPADRGDLGTETLINEKDVQNSGPQTGSRTKKD